MAPASAQATSSAVIADDRLNPVAAPAESGPTHRPHAAETARLYAADWRRFETWCRLTAAPALPASAAAVETFLASLTASHRPGSLVRHLAAIADQHRRAGHTPPDSNAVRMILRNARAAQPARAGTTALGAQRLTQLAASCPGDRAGLRDRALFLLLAASGLGRQGRPARDVAENVAATLPGTEKTDADHAVRRSIPTRRMARAALLTLQVEQVRFTPEGLSITLGSDAVAGRRLDYVRRAAFTTCPVHALEDWLRASEGRYGAVFRKVDRWGNVEHRALTPTALRQIFLRRGAAVAQRRNPLPGYGP